MTHPKKKIKKIRRKKAIKNEAKRRQIEASLSINEKIAKLAPKRLAYLQLRKEGFSPVEAYQRAGYSPLDAKSNAFHLEKELQKYFITGEDLLQDGRRSIKKILNDFLNDAETASVQSVTRIVQMQQDRIDPAVIKHESKIEETHIISLEIKAQIEAKHRKILGSRRVAPEIIDAQLVEIPGNQKVTKQIEAKSKGT